MNKPMIGLDIDGMVASYPHFFAAFIPGMQSQGYAVGILTGRSEDDKEKVLETFEKSKLKLDFAFFKPKEFDQLPNGVWKAVICRYVGIDYLFDDMQHDDPQWVSDFASVIGGKTVPFTTLSSASKPDGAGSDLKDYVEQVLEYLKTGKAKS